jgi:hypothetical protein
MMSADQKARFVAELAEILQRLARLVAELKASGIDPEEIAEALPPDLVQTMDGLFDG